MSIIRDKSLVAEGRAKISWVKKHMPVLNVLADKYRKDKPFKGLNIAICLHLEAKTAYLAQVLADSGANVAITGSNPLSTQDDVAAALDDYGVEVFSWYNATDEEYNNFLETTLEENKPNLIIDDGGDLVSLLHREDKKHFLANVIGGSEETTTGVLRLKAMENSKVLQFPMMAVNDAYCKYLFDNRYGTGQSVWDGIMRTTNLLVAGKNVVVVGYGWCGKGVAQRAKGLGGNVIVTEIDPIKAIEAIHDGFRVMNLKKASKIGDIFVTVTSCKGAISREHFEEMKDGAIISNAGHFDVEIDKNTLKDMCLEKSTARKNIVEYKMSKNKSIYLLAEGRLVNLAAGDGHPAEIMDLSFSLQALSLEYLKNNQRNLPKGVIKMPPELDQRVASLKLNSLGIEIDKLTNQQKDYLCSWDSN